MTHFIYVPFRGVGIKNGDDGWFRGRIEIFKKYTLRSLANQSDRDFTLWCSFRPEDEGTELVAHLGETIRQAGLDFVFTFDGLMYHDDRNLTANETLEERLARSLGALKAFAEEDILYPEVLLTRLDSDDMLHHDAVKLVKQRAKWDDMDWDDSPKAFLMMRGFVYDIDTGRMAEWRPRTNPPFHTVVFGFGEFFDAKSHLKHYGDWKSHEDTLLAWSVAKLPDWLYCVTVGGSGHISTHFDHPFRGKMIDDEKVKGQILINFGQ